MKKRKAATMRAQKRPKSKNASPSQRASGLPPTKLGFSRGIREMERLNEIEQGRLPGTHCGPC